MKTESCIFIFLPFEFLVLNFLQSSQTGRPRCCQEALWESLANSELYLSVSYLSRTATAILDCVLAIFPTCISFLGWHTKLPQQNSNNRIVFSHSSGSQKSRIEVWGRMVPPESSVGESIPHLSPILWSSSPWHSLPYVSIIPILSLLLRVAVFGFRARSNPVWLLLNLQANTLFPNKVIFWVTGRQEYAGVGVGRTHMTLFKPLHHSRTDILFKEVIFP